MARMQWKHSAGAVSSLFLVGFVAFACGGSSENAPAAKAAPGDAVSLTYPSLPVAANEEDTRCIVMRLGNDKPMHIGSIHNTLGPSSHHLVVYRVNDTVERTTPFKCEPFVDTLDPAKGSPLMVTQKSDDVLQLPAGVGFTIDAHQMVRLEMHYINPSSTPRTVTATSTFTPISDDDFKQEAGFLFIGNPDIRLPARKETKLGPTYFEIPEELENVNVFAITGHEHHLGTNVQIALATGKADPGKMIYDVPNWTWSEPKTEVFSEPIKFPKGTGFQFTCTWNNTTDNQVSFGESANAEMCFFWAYYYPSQGARVCFHTSYIQKETGGRDLCCPGDVYCNLIGDYLNRGKTPGSP